MQRSVAGLFFPDIWKDGATFIFKTWESNTRNKKKNKEKRCKYKKKNKKKKHHIPSKHQITSKGNVKHSM